MSADNSSDDRTRSFFTIAAGTTLLHYEIVRQIGAGGMGEVYLAEDTDLNRKVALKFLPPHLCNDEDCRKRFAREAQAAAKLDHPNIAAIHEVGEYRGRPFYAMQVVEGQSLKDVMAGKDLPLDRILEIGIQVCEGLQAAHDKGIIHRDIKPSNMLLDDHGRVRIVDFGLAAIRGSDQLTMTGSTLGTLGYMSPEQIQGKEIDQRSDLFSLGVVLYEMITKQNPFKRDNEAATLKAVSEDLPEPLARFKSGIPDGLQPIIDKALEKEAKTRYQHADGMLADLMRLNRSLDTGQSTVSVTLPARRSMRPWWIVGALITVTLAVALIVSRPWVTDTVAGKPDQIRLVVLPFENLGGPEDEYFADGITDAITSRLARISGLCVISRTSAKIYKDTEKTLKQIGGELDVGYVLEGTILWDKSGDIDRVRIDPQLIQVSDDSHIWAEEYERELTQIFAVQTDIASSIAKKLNITLLEPEREALAEIPTENTEAYHAYLAAREQESDSLKVLMYKRAIDLDPKFARAYADLSWHHSSMYQLNRDRSEERLQLAKRAADSALALKPDLPKAHLALGFYYYCGYREYDKALEEYEIARKGLPNDERIYMVEGWIRRRQGRFTEALDDFTKWFQLNPKSGSAAFDIASTNETLRNYEEALTYIDKAISLDPGSEWNYTIKTLTLILMGDPQSARRLLSNLPSPERAWLMWAYLEMSERNYDAALKHLSVPQNEVFNAGTTLMSVNVLRGAIYLCMGEEELARIAFDSARVFLESNKDDLSAYMGYQSALAMAYAGLGQKEKAIRLGQLELKKYPYSRDALEGVRAEWDMAKVYVMTGEFDAAIDLIEHFMSVPFELESVATLRSLPWWDPLRDYPRFQALIRKYEKKQEA
jgi:serine/threonine protein kinase/tetratricopeptide (TPR) repeat protein